ncbi:MAG: MBL fold metallo-hydrolase [Armatimonadota bacterium]|nr:MBL fold metallo-hydrolase [Armatimonadota bacterium]
MAEACFTQAHVLDTGYCLAVEATMIRGGRWRVRRMHSAAVLLKHPHRGWTLWDTGYTTRFYTETRRWPFVLYPLITPAVIKPGWSAAARLKSYGISPEDIATIVISHMHADHIGGLKDFPHAQYVVTAAAWDHASGIQGWHALRRAFIPSLIPTDFACRATLLPPFDGSVLPPFGPNHDLFGDGSLILVPLPGHARGQVGALATTSRRRLFLAADSVYFTASIRDQRRPSPITNAFVDDPSAVGTTIDALYQFSKDNPDVAFLPTHCPDALREWRELEL